MFKIGNEDSSEFQRVRRWSKSAIGGGALIGTNKGEGAQYNAAHAVNLYSTQRRLYTGSGRKRQETEKVSDQSRWATETPRVDTDPRTVKSQEGPHLNTTGRSRVGSWW